jgi:hypothetical protein
VQGPTQKIYANDLPGTICLERSGWNDLAGMICLETISDHGSGGTNFRASAYPWDMKTSRKLYLIATMALIALAASAQSKPNFSGNWELNVVKSDLAGAPITKLAVQVDHKDPVLKYNAIATVNGEDVNETGTIDTSGAPTTDSRGGQVKAHWDGSTLVVVTTDTDGNTLDTARMAVASDGKSMIRDYERTNDQQKRHEVYDKAK